MKKQTLSLLAMFLGVTAATFWVRLQSQTISRQPYTAWIETQYFAPPSPDPVRRVQLVHAVRGDGSSLRESRWDHDPHATQELVDTGQSRVYAIDGATRSYTEAPLRPESVPNRRAPVQASCESAFGKCEPGESLLGYPTYLVEIRPPGSGRVTKQWVTPALAWAALREETWQHGALTAVSTVARVVEGEPPAMMFHLPTGYRKVDAGQQLTESAAARGKGVDPTAVERIRQRVESVAP